MEDTFCHRWEGERSTKAKGVADLESVACQHSLGATATIHCSRPEPHHNGVWGQAKRRLPELPQAQDQGTFVVIDASSLLHAEVRPSTQWLTWGSVTKVCLHVPSVSEATRSALDTRAHSILFYVTKQQRRRGRPPKGARRRKLATRRWWRRRRQPQLNNHGPK